MSSDPEYAQRYRDHMHALHMERAARSREDPAYRLFLREQAREWYARNATRVQSERREREAALTPEERARREENRRAYFREWATQQRAQRDLNALAAIGQSLIERHDNATR